MEGPSIYLDLRITSNRLVTQVLRSELWYHSIRILVDIVEGALMGEKILDRFS